MTRTRRAALLMGLALLLGGLAGSDVARREAALRASLAPLVDVVVADRDLAPRHRLRPDDLAVRRLPARYAPVGAATVPEDLIGRRLAIPVPSGGALGPAQLQDPQATAGAPVAHGQRAVEVVGLASPRLVTGGSRVDVLVTRDRDAGAAAGTELALEDVEVLAARGAGNAGSAADGAPRVAATLRVSARQAVYLAAAEAFAREIRLLPRATGDQKKLGRLVVNDSLR
jgi:pilus assembly protein CpaB